MISATGLPVFLRKRFDGDRIPSHRDIRHHDRLEALRSLLHLIGLALARTHAEFFVDIDVLILDARTLALALGVIIIRTLFLIIMQVGLRNDRRELASLLGFRTICRGTACWRIPILIFVKTAGIIPAALSTLIPTRTLAALITARALPIGAIPVGGPDSRPGRFSGILAPARFSDTPGLYAGTLGCSGDFDKRSWFWRDCSALWRASSFLLSSRCCCAASSSFAERTTRILGMERSSCPGSGTFSLSSLPLRAQLRSACCSFCCSGAFFATWGFFCLRNLLIHFLFHLDFNRLLLYLRLLCPFFRSRCFHGFLHHWFLCFTHLRRAGNSSLLRGIARRAFYYFISTANAL